MNIYDCKRGNVVLTGDSMGMAACLCIEEKRYDVRYGFEVVTFLDLTTGSIHESGGKNGFSLDSCHFLDKISEERTKRVIKVWEKE